ncbi:MAG: cytochrome C [Myxococcota bacterium]|nr:cytochrome C [Myxococcota bacterium]
MREKYHGGLRRVLLLLAPLVLSGLGSSVPAHGAGIKTLIMPGPVIEGHADVEEDCESCHLVFDGSGQSGLCLDCHEEVAADVKAEQGFHGRQNPGSDPDCRICHSEHRGRGADIVGLAPETFDHDMTDFPLEGVHPSVACTSCHVSGESYREAPGLCIDCHRDDDRHDGQLGEDCADCHESKGWDSARFDHDETDFPLLGAHLSADCGLCHPGDRYEETLSECKDCHASQDSHRGKMGDACGDCHTTQEWEEGSFDHDENTDFALVGEHSEVACNDCHLSKVTGLAKDLEPSCAGCHAVQDDHDGSFGAKCEDCHSPRGWARSVFNHEREADFPLEGAHGELSCTTCHHGVLGEESLSRECSDCHRESDLHDGQLGTRCDDCHGAKAWTSDLTFDHDMTAFPLLGMHVIASCGECHDDKRFHDTSGACVDCHAEDDEHDRALGTGCGDCHNPNAWSLWRFDHALSTDFPLKGAHQDLGCQSCHSVAATDSVQLSQSCGACHSLDDPHRGGFGERCETCHVERSWEDVRMPR